jgi:hypothetical protein
VSPPPAKPENVHFRKGWPKLLTANYSHKKERIRRQAKNTGRDMRALPVQRLTWLGIVTLGVILFVVARLFLPSNYQWLVGGVLVGVLLVIGVMVSTWFRRR